MHFDWTISLGNLLTVAAFLGGLWITSLRFTERITIFAGQLGEHTRALSYHATRMEKQDELLLTIVRDVERLIGRLDTQTERRREPRNDGL